MKKTNQYYYVEIIALCESLGDDGIPVEFYKEKGYFFFGINGEEGFSECLKTKSLRKMWEHVSEIRKERDE